MAELETNSGASTELDCIRLPVVAATGTGNAVSDSVLSSKESRSDASISRGNEVTEDHDEIDGIKWQAITGVLNILGSLILAILGWFIIQMYDTMNEMNKEVITSKAVIANHADELRQHEAKIDDLIKKSYSKRNTP